jgi:2-polyprenyl-3-methyl-5-hydroxy-6-metoxy-1,4-benzoquinol methylase
MSIGYFEHARVEMLPFIPAGIQDALDIGCGEGRFGEALQSARGCRVTGVEPFPAAAAQAQARLYKVFCSSAESFLSSHEGKFDVISFNDVLEHLVDPWVQLQTCRRLLKLPGGLVIASLPNIRFLFALREIVLRRDFPYESAGIFDRTHLRFFTSRSMIRLFEESGFEVLRCEGINGLTDRRYTWVNRLTLRLFEDTLFTQFALVAKPRQSLPMAPRDLQMGQ